MSRTFLTEGYFNYTETEENIDLSFTDVQQKADDYYDKTETTLSVMIVVFVFLIIMGILGLIVEKTNLNKDEDEEDDQQENQIMLNIFETENKNCDQNDEYEAFMESENKLIMSKTLWGIILLSFSFNRNAKRLFMFSVIRRRNSKLTIIEGT